VNPEPEQLLLIQRHDLRCFAELWVAVRGAARDRRCLRIDVRSPFPDTPEDREERIEAAFAAAPVAPSP